MWHLPAAPAGLEYRPRSFVEKDAHGRVRSAPKGQYVAVGLFPPDAPNAQGEHLQAIPVLFLDCDLCDKFAAQHPPQDRDTREKLKALQVGYKDVLYSLPDETLNAHLEAFAAEVNGALQALTGQGATYIISSGYGLHAYLWLMPEQWRALPQILQAQLDLIQRFNALVGYVLADPNVKDAGTRVLRLPGSWNNKGPTPRPVRCLTYAPSWFSLHTLFATRSAPAQLQGPASPAPATAPAAGPQTPAGALPDPGRGGTFADFDKLFATYKVEARQALHALFNSCPFFIWAVEHPAAVGLRSWYGAATNIAAVADEEGRQDFHSLSRLDAARYNAGDCDKFYSYALQHVRGGGGPWTYKALLANGDWVGRPPVGFKAPAVLAVQKATAPDVSQLAEGLILDGRGFPRPVYTNLRRILRQDQAYGARLRFNEMRDCVEYDGAPIVDAFFGDVQEAVQNRYGLNFGPAVVQQALYEVAWQNRFYPVREYLENLEPWDQVDRIPLLLNILQSEDTPLHREYLRCFLIGAVRRPLYNDPRNVGVKVDTTLILHGKQGFMKSSFFRVLAGEWFSDSTMVPGSKDSYLSLLGNWIIEWGEFERAYSKDTDATKAFLSAQRDNFRRPFGKVEEFRVRRSIIVGSTNREHFLNDPTGDRRFHILPVRGFVRIDWLEGIRDQVWAQAVALHRAGVDHWLSRDVDVKRDDANANFRQEEPWQHQIAKWLLVKGGGQLLEYVSCATILTQCIQKETKDWRTQDSQQVGSILQALGYERKRVMWQGQRCYMYLLPGVDLHAIQSAQAAQGPVGLAPVVGNVLPFARPVALNGG